jgi:DNA mismatch endonuclease Vsr
MTDVLTQEQRSRNMAAIRSKDTLPELALRRLLHSAGYRFRLHRRDLPGKPDIVFPSRLAVVEVRGCFWHQHPDPACKNAVRPGTRSEWWAKKLDQTVARDAQNVAALQRAGWRVMIVWECEVAKPDVKQRLREFLGPPGKRTR